MNILLPSLILIIAGFALALISFLVGYKVKEIDSRFEAHEKRITELESNGKQRQDLNTRAGLLDSQANLNEVERTIIDMEAGLAHAYTVLQRIRDISGVLLKDPRKYPKEDKFEPED